MWVWALVLVQWVWNGLQVAADVAITLLQFAYRGLRAFGVAVWDASGWFYKNLLKPVGDFIHRAYDRLRGLYEQFVQPALNWLHDLSNLLRKIYSTFVAPILSLIDGVQRVLQLLELFHIQWAKELDQALQRLEDKLSQPLQLAIRFLNQIVNRVESYVLTADNLFQRVTHLRTFQRDLNAVLNLQSWRLMGTLTDKQKAGPAGAQPLAAADDHLQFMEDVYNGNDQATGIDADGALLLMEQIANGTYSPVMPEAG
jgi:hypothetical protein